MRRIRTRDNRAERRRHLAPQAPEARGVRLNLPWVSGWIVVALVAVTLIGGLLRLALGDFAWFQPGVFWRHLFTVVAILLAFAVFKESAWRREHRTVHKVRFVAGVSAGLMVGIAYSTFAGGLLMAAFIGVLAGLVFDLVVRK
ncbi:hypothetical protein C7S18_22470 [Ahniella affigens]|uniref:Uncharacterized protein n=1 Tax=Ahniella affigens TaxID=2021234 RepID=A0A2P1PY43_9GAMM|nr:hypothetical protein [Ahniella affigens]AVP99768.1 hypothetical protein C7S18_22470 [Ahniella affigens]